MFNSTRQDLLDYVVGLNAADVYRIPFILPVSVDASAAVRQNRARVLFVSDTFFSRLDLAFLFFHVLPHRIQRFRWMSQYGSDAMNKNRIEAAKSIMLACLCILAIPGCQGGLTNLPSLSSLNNPTRVPPPASGTFHVPSSYTDPSNGGVKTSSTTLGQLRSIETGIPNGRTIESDGLVASTVTNGSFKSEPVVAKSVSTLVSTANQFNRSLETAASAFSSNSATNPTHLAPIQPVQTASANSVFEKGGPAIIQAASQRELPDPRYSEAARGSLSSDEDVKWTSPQR